MKNEIKVLSGLDHIRTRPGMYIGSTKTPEHLFKEILDNAIDEVINKYATNITINIKDGIFQISDNGRGFPLHSVELENGQTINSLVASVEHLFSGGKFDNSVYEISKGLHGVGLSVVNALSEFIEFYIKDRSQKLIHYFKFENGKLITESKYEMIKEFDNISTRVIFKPDKKYFTLLNIDFTNILNELNWLNIKTKVEIIINNNRLQKLNEQEFVKLLFNKPELQFFNINNKLSQNEMNIYFSIGDINIYNSIVNFGICDVNYNKFINLFYKIINGNFKSLTKSDITNKILLFIDLKIKNPKYDSQNKKSMVSDIEYLFDDDFISELKNILSNDFFVSYFSELSKNKEKKVISKIFKNKTGRLSIDNPIKDCIQTPGEILYILEGESAEGTLKSIRNSRTEAILPVNGKIQNCYSHNSEIVGSSLKNKYILEAIGNKNNFRYKRVKIICDADPDGQHITVLLCSLIHRFIPELIDAGRLIVILPPLYGAVKHGKFFPIYDKKTIAEYENNGYNIKRFKGLGEMNPSELKNIIDNPMEYIVKSTTDIQENNIIRLILSSDLKKRLLNKQFSLTNFLTCCKI